MSLPRGRSGPVPAGSGAVCARLYVAISTLFRLRRVHCRVKGFECVGGLMEWCRSVPMFLERI